MFGTLFIKIPIVDVVFPHLRIGTLIVEIVFVKSDELGNVLSFISASVDHNAIIGSKRSTRNYQGFDGSSSILLCGNISNLVGWCIFLLGIDLSNLV
tara:strand:+ start:83 stop:373 length:291 start_codon:yes stop_codon:yes gene_type:complete